LKYLITLIYLDKGSDSFAIEYYNFAGELKNIIVNKTNSNQWKRQQWEINDAYFNDQFDGQTDIRINCNKDGDETIHLLDIKNIGVSLNQPCPGGTGLKSLGDANCDGKINVNDFIIWKKEKNKELNSQQSDFNFDKIINGVDFQIWRNNRE
jgi:hypothetical protein